MYEKIWGHQGVVTLKKHFFENYNKNERMPTSEEALQ